MNIRECDLPNVNKSGIYCITNLLNGKKYIGQSISDKGFIWRWRLKYNRHLTSALKKYGKDNFEYSIIEVLEQGNTDLETFKNIVSFWETYWILYYDALNPNKGYNECKYSHNTKGAKFYKTKEHRNKLSLGQNKLYSKHPEKRIMIGKERSEYFKTHPEKCYFNIRDNRGENNSFAGRHHTEKSIQKMITNHHDVKGKNNPSAKSIIQLSLDGKLVREYDYIKQVEEYGFCYSKVRMCIKHKYITKLGDNIYGKNGDIKYIWILKEENIHV